MIRDERIPDYYFPPVSESKRKRQIENTKRLMQKRKEEKMETNTFNEDATNADTLVYDQEVPERKQTPVEIAGRALVDFIAELVGDPIHSSGTTTLYPAAIAKLTSLADNLENALVREEAAMESNDATA